MCEVFLGHSIGLALEGGHNPSKSMGGDSMWPSPNYFGHLFAKVKAFNVYFRRSAYHRKAVHTLAVRRI